MNTTAEEFSEELSSIDSFEELQELESRLYSVIHYNNLSEAGAADLPTGYKIGLDESTKEIIITLESNSDNNEINVNDNGSINIAKEISLADNITESNALHSSSETKDKEVHDAGGIEGNLLVIDITGSELETQNVSSNANQIDHEIICLDASDSDDSPCTSKSVVINNVSKRADPSNLESSLILNLLPNVGEEILVCGSSEEDKSEGKSSANKKSKLKTKKSKKKLEKEVKKKLENSSKKFKCPKKWTTSMIKYYTKISSKKLNFDAAHLIKKMRDSAGRKKWTICNRDLNGMPSKRRIRCRYCKQFGHDAADCTEPIKPIVCYMCGEIGHRDSRCHNKKCLTCGRPCPLFIQACYSCSQDRFAGRVHCKICNSDDHMQEICPDVWRAFSETTKAGPLIVPSRTSLRKICCICRQKGHLDFECRRVVNRIYAFSNPSVQNYVNVAQVFTPHNENLSIFLRLSSTESAGTFSSDKGYEFLQNLSNTSGARLELSAEGLTVIGTHTQCSTAVDTFWTFLNRSTFHSDSFHKHKRKSTAAKKRKTI